MVDESAEAIVARLKAEGQLTRNSGTNSLKSLKNVQEQTNEKVSVVFEKMTDLFESINSSLLFQSSMLESLYNIQNDAYVMEKERIADEKRARLLSDEPPAPPPAPPPPAPPPEGPEPEGKKGNLLSSLFGDIFKGGIGKFAIRAIGAGAAAFVITSLIDGLKEGFGFGGGEEPVEGEPSVLKDIVMKFLPVGLGFFFGGIKGALIGGATSALLDMVEELTGFDIPDEIEPVIAAIAGVASGKTFTGGLIRWVLSRAVTNPIGLVIASMAGAILATKLLVENQKKVIEDQIKEVEDLTEKVKDTARSIKDRVQASDKATALSNITSQMVDPDSEIGRLNTAAKSKSVEARAGLKEDEGEIKEAAEDRLRVAFTKAGTSEDKLKVIDNYIKHYPEYTGNSAGERTLYFGSILEKGLGDTKNAYTNLWKPPIKKKLLEILRQEAVPVQTKTNSTNSLEELDGYRKAFQIGFDYDEGSYDFSEEEDFDIQPDTITSNPRKLTGAAGRKARRRAQKLSEASEPGSTNFNVAKGGDSINLTPVNNTTNNSYTTIVTSQSTALGNAVPIAFSA